MIILLTSTNYYTLSEFIFRRRKFSLSRATQRNGRVERKGYSVNFDCKQNRKSVLSIFLSKSIKRCKRCHIHCGWHQRTTFTLFSRSVYFVAGQSWRNGARLTRNLWKLLYIIHSFVFHQSSILYYSFQRNYNQ